MKGSLSQDHGHTPMARWRPYPVLLQSDAPKEPAYISMVDNRPLKQSDLCVISLNKLMFALNAQAVFSCET